MTLAPGVTVTLRPAGHILGSATVALRAGAHRVVFSGDLGRPHHPLLRPPADPPAADTIVVESTYGDPGTRRRTRSCSPTPSAARSSAAAAC